MRLRERLCWIAMGAVRAVAPAALCLQTTMVLSTALGQQSSVAEAPKKVQTSPQAEDSKALRFVKVDREGESPRSLQTAIARYEIISGDFKGRTVDLIGAVHIGSKEYYTELNKRFKKYDAVLYELVADAAANRPELREEGGFNPLAGLQSGMKDALNLSYQLTEIDYSPANFVHADMSPSEFSKDMKDRKDSFVGMFARMMGAGIVEQSTKKGQQQQADMMAAMLSRDPIRMRRVLAEQFDNMEGQMAGFADKNGKSTILTERNRKAFEVLQQELEAGKKSLAVFYGAAHLKDMHERLLNEFNAELITQEWLDAWPLK